MIDRFIFWLIEKEVELETDVLHHRTVHRNVARPDGLLGVSLRGEGASLGKELMETQFHGCSVRRGGAPASSLS